MVTPLALGWLPSSSALATALDLSGLRVVVGVICWWFKRD